MRPASIVDYLIEEIGKQELPLNSLDDVSLEKLRGDNSAGVRDAVIALVGVTGCGKTSLANRLFGADAGNVMASADTTASVCLFELASGLVVVDTPGAGGEKEEYENITRAYLGLPIQNGEGSEAPPISRYSVDNQGNVMCSPGNNGRRPDMCLFLIDPLRGGFDKSTFNFYQELSSTDLPLIPIITKCDVISPQERHDLSRNVEQRVSHTLFVSAHSGEGLHELVLACLDQLPGATASAFHRQVDRAFRSRRSDAVNRYIQKAAAVVAVSPLDEPGIEGLSRIQAIVMGASLRAAFDMGVSEEVWASSKPERIAREVVARLQSSGPELDLDDHEDKSLVKELILSLPRLVKLLGRLMIDDRVNGSDKTLLGFTVLYVISPIDLIPDFIPFIGQVDDILLVAFTLIRLINRTGTDVVLELWDGEPETLELLTHRVPDIALRLLPDAIASKLKEYAAVETAVPKLLELQDAPVMDVGGFPAVDLLYRSVLISLAAVLDQEVEEEKICGQLDALANDIAVAARDGDEDGVRHALRDVALDLA